MQTTWIEHGTVSGREALLLRSAEVQPLFGRFSDWTPLSRLQSPSPFLLASATGWVGAAGNRNFYKCFTAMRHYTPTSIRLLFPKGPETCACKGKCYVNSSLQGGICCGQPAAIGSRVLSFTTGWVGSAVAPEIPPSKVRCPWTCLAKPPKPLQSLSGGPAPPWNQLLQGAPHPLRERCACPPPCRKPRPAVAHLAAHHSLTSQGALLTSTLPKRRRRHSSSHLSRRNPPKGGHLTSSQVFAHDPCTSPSTNAARPRIGHHRRLPFCTTHTPSPHPTPRAGPHNAQLPPPTARRTPPINVSNPSAVSFAHQTPCRTHSKTLSHASDVRWLPPTAAGSVYLRMCLRAAASHRTRTPHTLHGECRRGTHLR